MISYISELNKEDDSETSPLLRLPGEIRNEIYGYLTIDCDVEIQYNPRRHFVSNGVGFFYSQEHRALIQINRQIRHEALSYILDHGKFWIRSLDPELFEIDMSNTQNCFRKLVIDLRHQESCIDRDTMLQLGISLGELCTHGRLDHIVIYSLHQTTSRETSGGYPHPVLIVEYLRAVLNSDIVRREVSVKEDFEHTGIIGSGHDSDSGSDCD